MSNLPKVSIITPTLNQIEFIERTITSVLDQDYPNLEYLIIDGGSTDGTLDLLKSLSTKVKWITENGLGQTQAINRGLKMCKGEIISWLNSDDVLLDGAIQKIVKMFGANPQVDMIYGNCDYIDADNIYISEYKTQEFSFKDLYLNAVNFIPQPATFFRRRILKNTGYLNERYSLVMDFDFWMRVALTSQILHIKEKLAAMRLHKSAKSLKLLGEFPKELILMYECLDKVPFIHKMDRELKRLAMRNLYYRAAHIAFWGSQYQASRVYALKGLKHAPIKPDRIVFFSLFGKLSRTILEKIRGNPYTFGVLNIE